jgi:hypothetical protein
MAGANAMRAPWQSPSLRRLNASRSETGSGVTIDAEGHS